jgi:hypothetical protein
MSTLHKWRSGFRLALWGAAWLGVAVCSAPALETNVVINEFMALNDSTITNKFGKYEDWIELYNTNSFSVSLKGWYLTDDAGKLNKWKFPTNAITTIAGKGFLLVWADNKSYSVTNNELHASFSLSGDGEYLALVKPDGVTVVSSFAPIQQYADMSYGIGANGEQRYFDVPTPGKTNAFAGASNEVAGVTFSPKRGVYTNTVPAVTARCDTAGAEIRYTTNAEPPATNSALYSTPFAFTHTAVIRAAAFKSGWAPSGIDTHSYIVLNDVLNQSATPAGFPTYWNVTDSLGTRLLPADYGMDQTIMSTAGAAMTNALVSLPTLSIVTPQANLFDPSTGIYVKPWADGWERAASAEWITRDNTSKFQIDCGLRIQGGHFRNFSATMKKSFSLRFRSEYGESSLQEDLFSGNAVTTFNDLVLRAGATDAWTIWPGLGGHERAQFIVDEFLRRTHLAMGGVSPHGRFVHLYLNGLYWGLYNVTEHVTSQFAAAYCGGRDETWDVLSYNATVNQIEMVDGSKDAWDAMILRLSTDQGSNATYQRVQGRNPDGTRNPAFPVDLDVGNYIDYMVAEYWSANGDWPFNNWRAFRDRNDAVSTGFKFAVWDAEFGLGVNSDINTDTTGRSEGVAVIQSKLVGNAEYKLRFADRVQKHLFNGGELTPAVTIPRYRALAAEIEPAILAESARWGDQDGNAAHTVAQWRAMRDYALNTFLTQRGPIFLQQLRNRGLYPNVDAPVFSRLGGLFTNSLNLAVTAAQPVYYTLDNSDPRQYGTGAAVGTLYTTGVALTRTTRVKARARTAGGEWSALTEAVFTLADKPALRVTELMVHPRPPATGAGYLDGDDEFIELQNAGAAPIGLAGLHFTQGVAFDFTEGAVAVLNSNEYVLVVKNIAAFTNRYPSVAVGKIAGAFAFPSISLDNAGENIEIEDAAGRTVVSFTYNNTWLVATDGAGHSLIPLAGVAQADCELDYPGNWKASVTIGGSPGQAEPAAPAPSLVLNEILAHTDTNSPPYDSNDGIELYNVTAAPIPLGSGWYLSDDPEELTKWAIPVTNTLAAHGWRYFDEMHDFHNPITNGFGLNKAGEQVLLSFLPGGGTGATDRVVDAVSFEGEENGVPLIRYPDGAASWFHGVFTPGASNQLTAAGLVIAEIMYHPKPTAAHPENNENDEYVELYNPTAQAIGLTNTVNDVGGVWRLAGGIGYLFPSNTVLPAGGRLIVVSFDPASNTAARTAFLAAYGLTNGQIRMLGPYSGQLNNKTDTVRLERPVFGDPPAPIEDISWHVIDQVTYYDAAPWPTTADGTGRPLARCPGRNSGDDAASWVAGLWPTPGMVPAKVAVTVPAANTGFLAPGLITVTAETQSVFVVGGVSQVVLAMDGATVASFTTAPYTTNVALNGPEGVRRLTARLTDGEGAYTSPAAEIMVYTNIPAFNAGLNQTINLTVTNGVGLHVAAEILSGMTNPVSFRWSCSGGGAVAFGNPTQTVTTASFTQPGTYDLLLTMVYGQLATSRVVTVTVVDANTTNRVPYQETFEGYELGSTLVGIGGWTGAGADIALIETNRYAAGPGGYPIAGVHERSLTFCDRGVANRFEQTGALTNVCVDMLVACVPWSREPPEPPSDAHFAVGVASNRHVAVWHGTIGSTNRWTELTAVTVNTNAYLRLTAQADYARNPQGWFGFRLWINGEPVTQPTNWFATASTNSNFLGSIAFSGPGQADELVVSTNNPFAALLASYWTMNVSLSGPGGTVNPPVGVYAVKVGDSTNVVATGNDWYRIQSLTTNGAPLAAAAGQKSYNAPIGTLGANGTNTVTVTFSGLAPPLVAGVPNAWASNYYTEAQAQGDPNLATDWLLGIDPWSGTNYIPGLAITALTVSNADLMIVMQLTTNGVPKNTTINGTLQVLGGTNLVGGFTNIVSAELPRARFSGNGEARTNFTGVATPQHFYKARIINPL